MQSLTPHYQFQTCKSDFSFRIQMTQNEEQSFRPPPAPSGQFAALQSVFRRRLLTGIGSASVLSVGANFCGITSFLLGFSPETARSVKLDALYPIGGYSRYIDTDEGFEFVYPDNWLGDQTLLYRAAGKAERSLDPPPIANRRRNVNEPVVAFGPPGSNGELNVSVIVSPVSIDFSIEAFGGPQEVGEAIVAKITGSGKLSNVKGTLYNSTLREDSVGEIKYYELEFGVESSMFHRHNVAVCCVRKGRLFTLNAQAPESSWPQFQSQFYTVAKSFILT